LLAGLLTLLLLVACPAALSQPSIQLLNTWPELTDLSIEIATGDPLFLALSYTTSLPVQVSATPLWQGEVSGESTASPVLAAGTGDTLLTLSPGEPLAVDAIRISYRYGNSSTETSLMTLPAAVRWHRAGLSSRDAMPAWLVTLDQQVSRQLAADTSAQANSALVWNLFITLIVIAVPGSIAWLNWAALKTWSGYWRVLAGAPLVLLAAWVGLIVLSLLLNPDSHRLWPFEIFVWAMVTVVYLVVLMTAKRAFAKAEQQPPHN
jgi:hypothetical protein